MRGERQKLRIPVLGWVFGAVGLVAVGLLAMPSGKQKRAQEAKMRLQVRLQRGKAVSEAHRNKQFHVFDLTRAKGQIMTPIWNPKSGHSSTDYRFGMPSLAGYSKSAKELWSNDGFTLRGIIFAPDPKSSFYTDYAVLCMVWENERGKWAWLDSLRNLLNVSTTQTSAISKIRAHLAAASPSTVAEARRKIAENVALARGVREGDCIYEVEGEQYVARSDEDYQMQQDVLLALPHLTQPPN